MRQRPLSRALPHLGVDLPRQNWRQRRPSSRAPLDLLIPLDRKETHNCTSTTYTDSAFHLTHQLILF